MSREWNVIVYGFEMHPHRVVADNRGAARWASFKAAREEGDGRAHQIPPTISPLVMKPCHQPGPPSSDGVIVRMSKVASDGAGVAFQPHAGLQP